MNAAHVTPESEQSTQEDSSLFKSDSDSSSSSSDSDSSSSDSDSSSSDSDSSSSDSDSDSDELESELEDSEEKFLQASLNEINLDYIPEAALEEHHGRHLRRKQVKDFDLDKFYDELNEKIRNGGMRANKKNGRH